jgi:hypothetical protein
MTGRLLRGRRIGSRQAKRKGAAMNPPQADPLRRGSERQSSRRCAVLLGFIGVALVLGAVAHSASGKGPSFAAAKFYFTGNDATTESLAIGDLNVDGRPDLVTANSASDTVSVLLNKGDGAFEDGRDYSTGDQPMEAAIGDLNGDGKPDLATANFAYGAESVSVLLNSGDGSFQAKLDYHIGTNPLSVAIGDLNGDGKQDLVTANPLGGAVYSGLGTVSVLLNRGNVGFESPRDYTVPAPAKVAIGDLNHDGKPDLVAVNESESHSVLSVLPNNGDGSFAGRHDFRTGSGSESIAVGDLNRDGKPDLVTANGRADSLSVLLNLGDFSFGPKRDYHGGLNSPPDVAIGDLTGDGKPDLVTSNLRDINAPSRSTIMLLINKGDGTFPRRLEYRTRAFVSSLAVSDLNGDGRPDLAIASGDEPSGVSVRINTPGLCNVQRVAGMTVAGARQMLARINCLVGKVTRTFSKVKAGRVISQKPGFGAVRPAGAKVNLVVSRGRKH